MDLAELLGVDESNPMQRRATEQVAEDARMLDDLVAHRRATMTQQEVADLMGISQGAVARIEAANRDPRLSTLRRYAVAVGKVVRHKVLDVDEAGRWASGNYEVHMTLANDAAVGSARMYSELPPSGATVLEAVCRADGRSPQSLRVRLDAYERPDVNAYVGGSVAAR